MPVSWTRTNGLPNVAPPTAAGLAAGATTAGMYLAEAAATQQLPRAPAPAAVDYVRSNSVCQNGVLRLAQARVLHIM